MKKIIRKLLPPIILDIIRKLRTSNVPQLTSNGFQSWWSNYSSMNSQTLPKDLLNMINYYINTEIFNATSGYWRYLCKQHIELLVDDGVGNFKQTIEKNHYWGEATLSSRLISPIMSNKVFVNVLTSEIFKVHSHCSMQESVQHNLSNIILLNYLVENGLGKYLEYMEEPLFGNPITLLYKERRISFSLLNSIIELDTILEYIKPKPGHRFLELGAGSGRTCIALLKTLGDPLCQDSCPVS